MPCHRHHLQHQPHLGVALSHQNHPAIAQPGGRQGDDGVGPQRRRPCGVPEGTMCREPHLLRFSPLFVEVSHEVVPVALQVHIDMFYGTTASGFKGLDPLYFSINPFPWYVLEFMEKVPTGSIDGKECSSHEVANYVQEKIGKALGFECTPLTRRDKYLMLASNEGIIDAEAKGR